MTATQPLGESALDGYWGSDNSQHVNFIGTDFHVHELYITPGAGWVDNDLTKLAGAATPLAATALHGYWGSDNSQHVNFIDTPDGHLHELYIAPGAGWVDHDLTALAGAVAPAVFPATTRLDGYWGSDGSQHVNFVGTDGHVHELYITPGAAGWVDNDLTKLAGAVLPMVVPPTPLGGYWGSDGSQHVNFIGDDSHVHELYITPGAAGWVDNDLTALSGGGVLPKMGPPITSLDGYWGNDNSQHVNFIGDDGHLRELYITPGVGWVDNNLTALSGGGVLPMVVPMTPLDGYGGSDGSQHVNFIGTDGHVHELHIAPGWSWARNDLTASAGAVPPRVLPGMPLDGYWGSDSSQHVNFIGTDEHVHELYIAPGAAGWVDNDLTALA